ncbi:hypothetical protein ABT160_15685 [Streptomyces sp. NPDC001941]|uniref:hypothetical protein n=1 Tax=Streptomyces sp. NPDC001941 TaxID=3154659 RepID=UPI0033275C7B
MHTGLIWVTAAAAGAGMGSVVRAYAYRLREHGRRETMTALARQFGAGGGSAHSVDEDGQAWTVRVAPARADGPSQRVSGTGNGE